MHPNPRRLLPLLTLLVGIAIATTSLYIPSIPDMARDFGVDVSAIQATLTVFLFAYGTSQLVHGPMSDRFGRRPVLLGGLAVAVLASAACALAPSVGFLILGRIAQAIGACAGVVISRAIVRDLFEREAAAEAMSIISATLAVAPAVGPVIGGLLEVWFGWRANFIFLALLTGLTMLLVWKWLPETNRHRQPAGSGLGGILAGYRALLASRHFWAYSATITGMFAGIFGFAAGAPVLLIDGLHISPDIYGLLAATPTIGALSGSAISAWLTARLGLDRLVLIGTLVYTSAGTLLAGLAVSGEFNAISLIGPMILFQVGLGIALPNSLTGVVNIFPAFAGSAAAFTGFLQMASSAVATFAVLSLPKTGPVPLSLVVMAAGFGGLVPWLLLRPRQARAG